ncbi:hypothetical protein EV182_001871 [Spiromyces aspiralis]|uniref:Uncharacterized protein n=1 Tax=Spiromyces aspiralis TaxID=68401 RepID=A0ACC1HWB8_9FUNG|nr:hypothetical protein EV182_001871 [Spiromyces aspiralis]
MLSDCPVLLTIVRRSFFFALWMAAHVVILVKIIYGYPNAKINRLNEASRHGICLCVAAVYVCMSPTFLMLLRRVTPLRLVTFEKNIHAHKVAGYTLVVWIIIHITVNYYQFISSHNQANVANAHGQGGIHRRHDLSHHQNTSLLYLMLQARYAWTGIVMLALYLIMILMAIPIVRSKRFELFYYMHQLHLPLTVFLFIHGHNRLVYKYISGPLALYSVDRLYRLARGYLGRTRITAIIQHPSDVYEIRIKKCMFPRMRAGQHLRLSCPSIAPLQWHPFTLTSAPEEDEISVHMKVVGDWTREFAALLSGHAELGGYKLSRRSSTATPCLEKQLSAEFDKLRANADAANSIYLAKCANAASRPASLQEAATGGGGVQANIPKLTIEEYNLAKHNRGDGNSSSGTRGPMAKLRACVASVREIEEGDTKYYTVAGQPCSAAIAPEVFVDGPYGAPAEHIFEYEVAIMIGAGIGVTPFVSVLRSIRWRHRNCPNRLGLRKVYFIWVCRDMRSFEWFKDLLISLEQDGLSDLIQFRTYFTGQLPADSSTDTSLEASGYCVPVAAADDDPYGISKVGNTIGGRTYVGRPHLESLVGHIGGQHPNSRVGLFFCGPKKMRGELRVIAHSWDNQLRWSQKTRIDFYADHF